MRESDISKSIFSLARYNNGKFKSQKQADFIIAFLKERGGYVGNFHNGYHAVDFTAEWDNEGITKITSRAVKSNKQKVVFQRKDDAVYQKQKADSNSQWRETYTKHIEQTKPYIKQLEDKIKDLEKSKQVLIDKGMDNYVADVDRMIKDVQGEIRVLLQDIAEWEAQLEKLK